MKTPQDIKLVTVGALIKDLKRFAKNHEDDDVVCYSSDGDVYYVETSDIDDDGDLWIGVNDDEYDGGYYTVGMLLNDLERYDATTQVYMGGFDEYLAFDVDSKGHIFAYDDENEVVACDGEMFEPAADSGHVRETNRSADCSMDAEKPEPAKKCTPKDLKDKAETAVLAVLVLLLVFGFAYNAYALFTHSGTMWENALWTVVCLVLVVIGSLTLYYSNE